MSLPGFPNVAPKLLISKSSDVNRHTLLDSELSATGSVNLERHSISSFGVQAVIIISYRWWSHSKTIFHENGAV